MNVYRRLRDLREDADKSQEEIAKIIGTSITRNTRTVKGQFLLTVLLF